LRQELSKLQADNAGLCRRVAREREIRFNAIVDRARLETELELETERAFNSGGCSSSALSSVTSSPALSASNSSLMSAPNTPTREPREREPAGGGGAAAIAAHGSLP
jgi:hypothetical protein